MGRINFNPGEMVEIITERVGFKSGLAISLKDINNFLDKESKEVINKSEKDGISIRFDEFEPIYYEILYKVGYTTDKFNGDYTGVYLWKKYPKQHHIVSRIKELYLQHFSKISSDDDMESVHFDYIAEVIDELGTEGFVIAMDFLEHITHALDVNPHSVDKNKWNNIIYLKELYDETVVPPEFGEYIDQRYINFLANNPEDMHKMHWRKFEELTAEYFQRNGFKVELGPGRNDDGIDIRVWDKSGEGTVPTAIIQCKREKKKIEKIVVKGLYADMSFNKVDYGLVVTTSELSVGARNTIKVRGYNIEEVNKVSLKKWLIELRTPGSGLVKF